jgi:DNA-binding MarR family transcriptional regulator
MNSTNKQLQFLIGLSQVYSKVHQIFDRSLIGGIGFNDFLILYLLSNAEDEKMRRIDLAEKIGLTPSGITRMLLPMEKIGLIKRETDKNDARVSFVKLAPGGKRIFKETLERAELVAEEIISTTEMKGMKDLSDIFSLFTFDKIWR